MLSCWMCCLILFLVTFSHVATPPREKRRQLWLNSKDCVMWLLAVWDNLCPNDDKGVSRCFAVTVSRGERGQPMDEVLPASSSFSIGWRSDAVVVPLPLLSSRLIPLLIVTCLVCFFSNRWQCVSLLCLAEKESKTATQSVCLSVVHKLIGS